MRHRFCRKLQILGGSCRNLQRIADGRSYLLMCPLQHGCSTVFVQHQGGTCAERTCTEKFRIPKRNVVQKIRELGVPKPGCLQFLHGSALLHSFAPFCTLLHSFADLRLHSFAVICALLRSFACFCERPRLERPRRRGFTMILRLYDYDMSCVAILVGQNQAIALELSLLSQLERSSLGFKIPPVVSIMCLAQTALRCQQSRSFSHLFLVFPDSDHGTH